MPQKADTHYTASGSQHDEERTDRIARPIDTAAETYLKDLGVYSFEYVFLEKLSKCNARATHQKTSTLSPGEAQSYEDGAIRSGDLDPYNNKMPRASRPYLNIASRPLWVRDSELHLLKGVRAGIVAHQFLCSRGVVHRDINPRNILLFNELREDESEAFLMDLEPPPSDKLDEGMRRLDTRHANSSSP
ncbi:hypothetical protein EVG20_g7867 [Dentipellis fragilis]|uniref:Fungal-type protein kinase domain-containing protein n=1 Tax=Dentipellis fragilis TaxID=205917 RepID=A0A4Y9YEC2_9AGAM|nr:hypothetical protein EVG20_g7867 [Dentipellis fragilis]